MADTRRTTSSIQNWLLRLMGGPSQSTTSELVCQEGTGVARVSEGIPSLAERERAAAIEQARMEKQAREKSAEAALNAAKARVARESKRQSLRHKVESLRRRAHRESHFLDTEFQQQYAQHYLETILREWKDGWGREYDEFMQDADIKQLAGEEAPQVLEWLEARVKIVQLAERITVAPPPMPGQGEKKMTAEKVRALRLRKEEDQIDDNIARTTLKAKKIIEVKAALESLQLEDEERERLETELVQEILEPERNEDYGKGNTTL